VALTAAVGAMAIPVAGRAQDSIEQDSGRMWDIVNQFIVGYDDNIYQTPEHQDDSFKISDALILSLDVKKPTRYFSLRYRPQYTWWEKKEPDNTDWSHVFSLVWTEEVSRKLSLSFIDSFTYVDEPELIGADGSIARADNAYLYNTGTLTARFSPKPTLDGDASVRYAMLRYEEDRQAEREDYDLWVFGLTGRDLVRKDLTALVDVRYENLIYRDAGLDQEVFMAFPGATNQNDVTTQVPDRGSDTWQFGLGLQKTFSPSLVSTLRGGWMYKQYEAANTENEDAPYVDLQLTKSVSLRTQFALSAGYSLYRSDVLTYAGQTRYNGSASVLHDLTAKIRVGGGLTYVHSEYNAEQSVVELDEVQVQDGSEDAFYATLTASYEVDLANSIEASYTFSDLSSDVQQDFERNQYRLGWRLRL
jgi:hypothetical protein